MQGRLGHQVLGQMLVMNTNEAVLAGASLVVTATTGQRSAVGQIALRTVVPTLAVRLLLKKEEERLERREARLTEREREQDERRIALNKRNFTLRAELDKLRSQAEAAAMSCATTSPLTAWPLAGARLVTSSPSSPLVTSPLTISRGTTPSRRVTASPPLAPPIAPLPVVADIFPKGAPADTSPVAPAPSRHTMSRAKRQPEKTAVAPKPAPTPPKVKPTPTPAPKPALKNKPRPPLGSKKR